MHSTPIKISVITVCFNAVNTIENTILSVINQDYPNIEYLIIDGGSIDGTINIIKKYSNLLSYWVTEPDKGIYDAMNKGISRATGDFIIFINSEDILKRIPIVKLRAVVNSDYAGLCGAIECENKKIIYPVYNWKMKLYNHLPHQGLFYKRKYLTQYDLKWKIVSDYDYNLRLYLNHKKIAMTQDVISYHVGTLSATKESAQESRNVVRQNCGIVWFVLSYISRKLNGLKGKLSQ